MTSPPDTRHVPALGVPLAVVLAALPLVGWTAAPARADLFGVRPQLLYPRVVLDPDFVPQRFGATAIAGDFDGDGDDDLAAGAPGTDITLDGVLQDEAGSVHVFPALGDKFEQLGHLTLTQAWFADGIEPFDHFGEALASGDFDGDGRQDLAIGVPGENLEGPPLLLDAGLLHVVYFSARGPDGGYTATVNLGALGATPADNDRFGAALASGDFDGDGFDDLAIGVPGRDVGALDHAGWVVVVYGSATGLAWSDYEHIHQDVTGVLGTAAANERFGSALAVGNFGGLGPDDLAIGVPQDAATGVAAGAVHILYGAGTGLLPADGDQFWHQSWLGVDGDAEAGDRFAAALAAADFDGDGLDDLAVGVPGEDDVVVDVGGVHYFYGDAAGFLSLTGNVATSHPCECGCPGMGGLYGEVLAAGDVDGAGGEDLVVGLPLANWGVQDSGMLCLVYDGGERFQAVNQDLIGPAVLNEEGDNFGRSIAIGRLGGRRYVAAGIPFEEVPGSTPDEGRVAILYDALFADGFESGDTSAWSTTQPLGGLPAG